MQLIQFPIFNRQYSLPFKCVLLHSTYRNKCYHPILSLSFIFLFRSPSPCLLLSFIRFKPFRIPSPQTSLFLWLLTPVELFFYVFRNFSTVLWPSVPLSRTNHSPLSNFCLTPVDWHKVLSLVFTISYYPVKVADRIPD